MSNDSDDEKPSLLPSDPNDLLTDAEHQQLNADLAYLADIRRRAESQSGYEPMA